jgi:hypothetical protein
MNKIMRTIICVFLSATMLLSSHIAQAKNDNNNGNGIGIVDETIGVIVKGIAIVYIDTVDVETARGVALSYVLKVDDKTFDHYYTKAYHQASKDVPYEIFSYCGVPSSMSRAQAIGEIATFSKERAKDIANHVPNKVVGACFRRFVHDKFQQDLSEEEVRNEATSLAKKVASKINNRF